MCFLGTGAVLLAAVDLALVPIRMPEHDWQVPRAWLLRFSPRQFAVLYGAYLGIPVLTRVPNKTVFLVVVAALIWAAGMSPIVILGLYGAGRATAIGSAIFIRAAGRKVGTALMQVQPGIKYCSGGAFAWLGGFFTTLAVLARQF